jgi:tRNA C32,U32 (ribose-2'-O)-methylase TrmJ
MPIRLLLEHDHAFTPEDVKVLIEAFEETLRALNLVDREDRLTMTVAKLIIEFAKEGERDPNRLRELVMKTLQPE